MIQANELRIDNLIEKSLKSGQGRKLISKIGCQDIVRISENIGSFNYDPIPLTEEILLKCGFSSPINGWHTSPNGTLEFGFNGEGKLLLMDWFLEITSLHQLQNLYFALTNTELEINL